MNKFLILKTKLTPPLEGVRGEVLDRIFQSSSDYSVLFIHYLLFLFMV